MQTLQLSVNLQTCLCLLGLTPGAIYWPQSALSGIRPLGVFLLLILNNLNVIKDTKALN